MITVKAQCRVHLNTGCGSKLVHFSFPSQKGKVCRITSIPYIILLLQGSCCFSPFVKFIPRSNKIKSDVRLLYKNPWLVFTKAFI